MFQKNTGHQSQSHCAQQRNDYRHYPAQSYAPNYLNGGYRRQSSSVRPLRSFYQNNRYVYSQDGHTRLDYTNQLDNLVLPKCSITAYAQIQRYAGTPWKFRDGYSSLAPTSPDRHVRIGLEINDFYNYIAPCKEEWTFRKAIFVSLRDRIMYFSEQLGILSVQFYGSFSSGTYLPISDIDLIINLKSDSPHINSSGALLSEIADILLREGCVQAHCQLIDRCRVPLLKYHDSVSGTPINISVNAEFSRQRTFFIKNEFQKSSLMQPILAVLKYYLATKNFNEVYTGGVSSYALALMVIFYFQTSNADKIFKRGNSDRRKLGELFMGFLKFWGNLDQVESYVYHVGPTCFISESPFPRNGHQNPGSRIPFLKILDHHSKPNCFVTAGSFNSMKILDDFNHVYKHLHTVDITKSEPIMNITCSIPDAYVDYRNAFIRIYKHWFTRTGFTSDTSMIDAFSSHRNENIRSDDILLISDRKSDGTLSIYRQDRPPSITPPSHIEMAHHHQHERHKNTALTSTSTVSSSSDIVFQSSGNNGNLTSTPIKKKKRQIRMKNIQEKENNSIKTGVSNTNLNSRPNFPIPQLVTTQHYLSNHLQR